MPPARPASDSSDGAGAASGSPRRLVVIDGANTLYRAFFAIPPLRAPDGTPTNAVHGFVNMLLKVLREEAPDLLAVVFDARGKTFRHRLFDGYKATRDKQPEELSIQFPIARELVEAHHVPLLEVEDFEADDVIATLVREARAADDDTEVVIVSTDKDLMQLVDEHVTLLDTMKDRRYDAAQVEERFGVPPDQLLDLRSLVGDPSDNIPGVKGIGEKGAAGLLREWGTLENLLEHAADVKAKRARTALDEHADEARLSKQLSTLRDDVPLPVGLAELGRREPDAGRLREIYERLGFTRLLSSLESQAPGAGADAASSRTEEAAVDVRVVASETEWTRGLQELAGEARCSLVCVTGSGTAVSAALQGVAVATGDRSALYAPVRPEGGGAGELELDDTPRVPESAVLAALGELLIGDGSPAWESAGAKEVQSLLGRRGLELAPPACDVEIAAFLLDPAGAHGVASQAAQRLGRKVASWEDLAGRGARARAAAAIPVDELSAWAGERVCAVRALVPLVRENLEADGLASLCDEVEMPLTGVLSRMERNGVRVDEEHLARLSDEYEEKLRGIEQEIYTLAGEKFLITSPKQLQKILFEKLELPVVKKTKTGYSTDESVLEQLATHHELPARILAYRRLAKLKSTYLDALPPLVDETTGRVHPTFHQTGAATGRLSASQPNVQNIPIRTEEGIRIRETFVPSVGNVLLSADYSQVELRILAHYSGDQSLIDAFSRGEDIHRRTAAEVAGIEPEAVSDEQRARAKAVNFGIIYGSSAFGLANQLGIATGEAQATIDAYFARYEGVKRFLDETVSHAREQGYTTTLLGRRRYLPDLASRNRVLRQAAERMAVNSVVQGTAADLMKKAMVDVDRDLAERPEIGARMLLQVHDELVFEVPPDGARALGERVRMAMEGVHELRVPLVVEVGTGANWREAH